MTNILLISILIFILFLQLLHFLHEQDKNIFLNVIYTILIISLKFIISISYYKYIFAIYASNIFYENYKKTDKNIFRFYTGLSIILIILLYFI